jgi:pSer/pThr/pTyr-binding forkhead associated (FHA) protein
MIKLHVIAGTETYQVFEVKDPITYVGRTKDNDIQIKNQTVSRKHLKIVRRGDKYFITDLESRNGTVINGKYIDPGIELEAPEGVPIAVGMSLICLGEGCIEQMKPILDTIGFTEETDELSDLYEDRETKPIKKK